MRVIYVIRELRGCDKSEEIFLVKKKKDNAHKYLPRDSHLQVNLK